MAVLERIPLRRQTAVIREGSITVRPDRAHFIGPLIELGIAAGAIWLIVTLMDRLPLAVLALLLVIAMLLGPIGVLGMVFGAVGSTFVMERHKQSARWQQGFLGLGIGTSELVPFWRIAHLAVRGDYDDALRSGERNDLVHWVVELVKDNGRTLEIATVIAPRPLAGVGLERANRLAERLAALCDHPAQLAALPEVVDATEAAAVPLAVHGSTRRRGARGARPARHLPPPPPAGTPPAGSTP